MSDPADIEVEVAGNEFSAVTLTSTSELDLTVSVESVTATNLIADNTVVEVIFAGPVMVADPNAVQNEGNAPGLLVLEAADPVPGGTPVGTVILRKP